MEGGCHCGRVRFETSKKPFWIGACYCIDCRKISGAPYMVFVGLKKGGVHFLKGKPMEYASSEKVTRSFCGHCGSPVSYIYKDNPEELFISVGLFDDPSTFVPQHHIWVSQKLPWVSIEDDPPQE